MKIQPKILFYLKKRAHANEVKIPVYLRITVGTQRAEIFTGNKVEHSLWNTETWRARANSKETKRINANLTAWERRVKDTVSYIKEFYEEITADTIKSQLLGKPEKRITLLDVFSEHNQKVADLVNEEYAPATLTRYQVTLRHVTEFLHVKYRMKDIPVKEINYAFITDFEFFLRTTRKCNNNSAMKYIKNLGKIIRICLANGWMTTNPFLNFKIRIKRVERPYLTADELDAVSQKNFDNARLDLVRDIFLFGCYTGLAYIDIANLTSSELVKGFDGKLWIFTVRKKTLVPSRIPLLPFPLTVLEKYNDDRRRKGRLLPILSNQKMNAYLKEIAKLCGIEKELTFHISRHTFATTITLSNGVSMESVSKMLGHTNITTTQEYAKILESRVAEI